MVRSGIWYMGWPVAVVIVVSKHSMMMPSATISCVMPVTTIGRDLKEERRFATAPLGFISLCLLQTMPLGYIARFLLPTASLDIFAFFLQQTTTLLPPPLFGFRVGIMPSISWTLAGNWRRRLLVCFTRSV